MTKVRFRRIISLLVVLCMMMGLMPMAFAEVTFGPNEFRDYTYVGAGLAKLYDGQPVSFNALTDIAINGETNVFNDTYATVTWIDRSATAEIPLDNPPTEVGYYALKITEKVTGAADEEKLRINFMIFDETHEHSFGNGWQGNNDGKTHSRICSECGLTETHEHNYGEWLPVSSYGEQGQYQYRVCSECGFSEDRTGIYTITYDYKTNGGTAVSLASKEAEYNTTVDLAQTASKSGYEFVGWSLKEGSTEVLNSEWADRNKVNSDLTLYAVFKKTQNVRFYSKNGTIQAVIPVEIYNNETSAEFPEGNYHNGIYPDEYEGYTPLGWRKDTDATDEDLTALHNNDGALMITDVFKDYYAVYSRDITLSYDTRDDNYSVDSNTQQQYFNSAGNYSEVEFVLADLVSTHVVDDFRYWAIGSTSGAKYTTRDKITLTEDTTAYGIWTADLQNITKYTVTYDYQTNGGTSITAPTNTERVVEGDKLALENSNTTSIKDGWDFVGWNTDKNAHEGLTEITVNENTTLYAIFKKGVTASFYQSEDVDAKQVTATLYNKDTEAALTAPEPVPQTGWTASGWEKGNDSTHKQYSGTIKISENTAFYPVYAKYITLTYDTNGSDETIQPQSAVIFKYGQETNKASLTLAAAPVRDGYTFTGWTLSSDPTKGYRAGETAELNESAVATAQWQKNPEPEPEQVTVKYNAAENGGYITSTTAQQLVTKGESVNWSAVTAEKAGWDFVGWNTDKDAKEGLSSYTANADTTLYAIFKKDIKATFYSGAEKSDNNSEVITRTLWNSETAATVTASLEAASIEDWEFDGWRADKHTLKAQYKNGSEIQISKDTDFYAVYKRDITVTGTTEDIKDTFTQYSNTGGGVETITYMLEEPEEEYKETETETERFTGWEVTVTDEETGEKTTTVYPPGTPVLMDSNTTIKAQYTKVPLGAELPTVETLGASVESATKAMLSAKAETDSVPGNEITKQGFVYWSKLGNESKHTVTTEENKNSLTLENLSPSTEYFYYAFAENAAGTAKGYVKSFKTDSDGSAPNALMITPEYVSVKVGEKYQLLATLLPVAADNKIVWSSDDESKVTVDEDGMLTAKAEGKGIVITATTEVGRLTAECIVDVTADTPVTEMNFSEWNMAARTSDFAKDNNGFDWDTANYGGNHTIATAYLARWDGAVLEENDTYPEYNSNPASLYKKVDSNFHVQNVEWIPRRTSWDDNDEIKSALTEYGAVYSLMSIDWDCFGDNYLTYYCPYETTENGHAITIVGWDDNYDKSNFEVTPAGNGAFICKNSWGTEIGDDGFFYISYYDANLGKLDQNAVVTGAESNTNYNEIYQYDPLGAVGYFGYDNTTYAANVFPASGSTLTNNESLEAVSFYTYHKNTSYDVYIVTDYKNSDSLKNLDSPLASGIIKNAGYHTINLKNSVSLKSGTRFAVVVKLDTPGETSFVYCEMPISGYSSNAKANADESYYSYNGKSWADLTTSYTNTNFCIKAFTKNTVTANSAQLLSAIDNANREYTSDKVYSFDEAKAMGLPVNEDYIEFVNSPQEKNGISLNSVELASPSMGSMPSIIKAGSNSVSYAEGARFPSRYNLAEMGLVSSVKDQGEWGTCWAHSMYASLESCMLRKGMTTSNDESDPEVILSRTALTMSEDSSVTLAKKITPLGSEDKTVVWVSSDETVAKVDTNGTIRALKAGSATVSATTVSGGITGNCSVVVESDAEETVELLEKSVHKAVGDKFMVAYMVTPLSAEEKVFGWVSDNPSVAAVNENGAITAVADGTAAISIISDGIIKDTVTVTVGTGYNISSSDINTTALTFNEGTLSGNVTVKITNKNTTPKEPTVILALYDSSDTLAGIISDKKVLQTGENTVTFENAEFENISAGEYKIKCLAWNSFDKASPLAQVSEDTLTVTE